MLSEAQKDDRVDVNPVAVAAARQNAEMNGLAGRIEARQSDVFDNVSGSFDLMIFAKAS